VKRAAAALLVVLAAPAAAEPADHPLTLPDGRVLNLLCDGARGPVVLFDSGWAADSRAWRRVMAGLAGSFRVCAQDRAGAGSSSPGPLPRDGEAIARDLKGALEKGQVPGPYILVGHSLGALNMRTFQRLFPADTAAMVLVDPSLPQSSGAFPAQVARARACLAAARGAAPEAAAPEARCRATPPEKAAERWEARLSELESMAATSAPLVVQEVGSLKIPLIILTAGKTFPDAAQTEGWHALHKTLSALSTKGEARLIPDSGHMMMLDRPDAIVTAVEDASRKTR
jgi:pimeloyl-ACP methyl ester carboxylesterase